MTTPEVEEFAKILVEYVRDAAIRGCDGVLRSVRTDGNGATVKRWREAAQGTPEEFAKVLIPDIVDETVANLLTAIDQELFRILFVASNANVVDLGAIAKESGEMSGWYGGSRGWCEKYSKERITDDFADLKNFFNKPPESKP